MRRGAAWRSFIWGEVYSRGALAHRSTLIKTIPVENSIIEEL